MDIKYKIDAQMTANEKLKEEQEKIKQNSHHQRQVNALEGHRKAAQPGDLFYFNSDWFVCNWKLSFAILLELLMTNHC